MQKNQFFKVKKIRIKKNFDRIETQRVKAQRRKK